MYVISFLIFISPTHSSNKPYFTRLRIGLSDWRNYKFRLSLSDLLVPICDCGEATETPKYYLLHCPNFIHERQSLLQNIEKINPIFLSMNENSLTKLLLRHFILKFYNWLHTVNKTVWYFFGNHKFRLNVPICDCGRDTETSKHYLLHWPNFIQERQSLLQNIDKNNPIFLPINKNSLSKLLLKYFMFYTVNNTVWYFFDFLIYISSYVLSRWFIIEFLGRVAQLSATCALKPKVSGSSTAARGELSAVIAQLMSKCLWSGRNW